ncbi:amidase [Terricaulis silvestris]|uniref:6-aminohexanoate-cyclic-dimer hydrolase n=1 Tax=Terricaulis silvestris TaxID=2686094 RepID=A0A6I6MQN6_9CAUL|nr:amidase [Terricaulis silvestris]QGZ95728.1 6-aminohexanoate-cyclic-dimer hydrolase [Terricaulis silvestris]
MTISRRELVASAAALSSLTVACASPAADTAAPSDALGDSDATAIAARIRNREITATEALEAAIARAERVNPQLNFIASPMYDAARERAQTALSGPFAGVPTLIKDLLPVTGWPTKYGSRAFERFVPTEQSPYADALFASGLVPFGKSTTPEFGLTATTESLLQGATRNPWDVTRSSGGSSGGAAVAVAARVVPVAHASDGGGSIRIPASCNGLFGLKPSRGRTFVSGTPDPGIQISVNGCVSRSVRDSAAWLAATEQTGAGAALPATGVVSGPNRQRLRIIVDIPNALGNEPDLEVRAAVESAAELCRSLGHEVREQRAAFNGRQFSEDFILIWANGSLEVVELVRGMAPAGTPLEALLEPLTLELAAHARAQGPAAVVAAVARLRQVEVQYAAMFSNADIYLTPVLAKPPIALGQIDGSKGMAVFATLSDYVGYTPLQNVAGAPAMSVPLAWSAGGLPIGSHFSAPAGQERRLLELAYELEQAQPWASRRPTVNAG